jgi:hypothetical protein
MTKRRTHSLIDNFPAALRDAVTRMLVDNEWPADFPGEHTGSPRHEDCVLYCTTQGYSISLSSIGRYAARMKLLSRMKQAGVIVRDVMKDLTKEKASETQKAVAEMITAQAIDFISSQEKMTAKEIMDISRAIRDNTAVSISADKYIRDQLKEKAEAAVEKIVEIGKKKNLDSRTLKMIREQIYGIVA